MEQMEIVGLQIVASSIMGDENVKPGMMSVLLTNTCVPVGTVPSENQKVKSNLSLLGHLLLALSVNRYFTALPLAQSVG